MGRRRNWGGAVRISPELQDDANSPDKSIDRLGTHTVSSRRCANDSTSHQYPPRDNTPRPRDKFRDYGSRQQRSNHYKPSSCSVNQGAFLARSHRFRTQILQNLDQARRHIQQWLPEKTLGVDEMDWQPEVEIRLPAPLPCPICAKSSSDTNSKLSTGPCHEFDVGPNEASAHLPPSPPPAMRPSAGDGFDAHSAQRKERSMGLGRI